MHSTKSGSKSLSACLFCMLVGGAVAPAFGQERSAPPVEDQLRLDAPILGPVVPPSRPVEEAGPPADPAKWAPAVQPKPLSEKVKRGLAWLVKTQASDGGWSQGEESQHMGAEMARMKDTPNVADTCVATLALIRTGSTPKQGANAENIRKGVNFLCAKIEGSDSDSLYVTDVQGTRLQMKLGTYIDTFLAAALLAEIKEQMPDESGNKRVSEALDKVMRKIEKNQRQDGTWANAGWAPVLAQSMASKGINRAAQAGAKVSEEVRVRAEEHARDRFDEKQKAFSGTGSADVELYAAAASVSGMQDSANTNDILKPPLLALADRAAGGAQGGGGQAVFALKRMEENEYDLKEAKAQIVAKMSDDKFVAGFGSNGGEEFLSYMLIGESLVVDGGKTWEDWDKSITGNLNEIQNEDGSWTGHHCVTGRTFCTAAALLVLTVDRAPVPLAAKMSRR